MDANQPILRNRITLRNKYNFCVFELVTNKKKRENECIALYIGKQKNITRNVYNECFIISHEPQRKKRKKLVYIEKFLTYQNAEMHE